MSEYVSVGQFAKTFGVSKRTVRSWIRRDLIVAKRDRVTSSIYIPITEVERRKLDLEAWAPGVLPAALTAAKVDDDVDDQDEDEQDVQTMAKAKPAKKQAEEQEGREEKPNRREEGDDTDALLWGA